MMRVLLLWAIRFYQGTFSRILPSSCRFVPTCSEYAHDAVSQHGAWRGFGLAMRRVWRCRPGGGSGYDPVPDGTVSRETPERRP